MPVFIEVAAGLVFRAGKLLLTRRYPEAHQGGLWEFPGGKREPNESFPQCLQRELREELGIEVLVGQLVETITHAYPEKTVLLKFFHCTVQSGEPRALGCADLRWVTPEELGEHDFPPADQRLLGYLQAHPELWREDDAGTTPVDRLPQAND